MIDVRGSTLKLKFGEEEAIFDMKHATHLPPHQAQCNAIDIVQELVQSTYEKTGNNIEIDSEILKQVGQKCFAEAFHLEAVYEDELESLLQVPDSKEQQPELKKLPDHVTYKFLEPNGKCPVIVSSGLDDEQSDQLLSVLRKHRRILGYSIEDMIGISPSICTHRIHLEEDSVPSRDHKRRLNPKIQEVAKKEVLKLLEADIIYPISDSEWVSPIHIVPKKGGLTVETSEAGEELPTRKVAGWRLVTDFRKLNKATRKDHFPLPFIDQMLERLAGHKYFCYLDGYSGFLQIPIHPVDQEKTTFTCPYGTFAYKRLPFGLCNAPGTF